MLFWSYSFRDGLIWHFYYCGGSWIFRDAYEIPIESALSVIIFDLLYSSLQPVLSFWRSDFSSRWLPNKTQTQGSLRWMFHFIVWYNSFFTSIWWKRSRRRQKEFTIFSVVEIASQSVKIPTETFASGISPFIGQNSTLSAGTYNLHLLGRDWLLYQSRGVYNY